MELRRSIRKLLNNIMRDSGTDSPGMRVKPGQETEAARWIYAPSPDFSYHMAAYAFREWISTAINRVAEMAMASPVVVKSKDSSEIYDNHPLLDLIGMYGRPNDSQDSLEFLEGHFQQSDIFGNSIWFWSNSRGGSAPDEVFRLEPDKILIVPGTKRTIKKYIYRLDGREYDLMPEEILHFRRSNPLMNGMYWGLSAIDVLRNVVESDKAMSRWNRDFFETGGPSGILIVDADTVSSASAREMEEEFHLNHASRRRVAVIRAKQGSAVWNDAMLKQREMEFGAGRLLMRQAAFDALGFHAGMVSEASTEAHARVAERRVLYSVYYRHIRTASVLNNALGFWKDARNLQVCFADVRQIDWTQEALKLKAVQPFMDVNEVRAIHLGLPARKGVVENGGREISSGTDGASSGSGGASGEIEQLAEYSGQEIEGV